MTRFGLRTHCKRLPTLWSPRRGPMQHPRCCCTDAAAVVKADATSTMLLCQCGFHGASRRSINDVADAASTVQTDAAFTVLLQRRTVGSRPTRHPRLCCTDAALTLQTNAASTKLLYLCSFQGAGRRGIHDVAAPMRLPQRRPTQHPRRCCTDEASMVRADANQRTDVSALRANGRGGSRLGGSTMAELCTINLPDGHAFPL